MSDKNKIQTFFSKINIKDINSKVSGIYFLENYKTLIVDNIKLIEDNEISNIIEESKITQLFEDVISVNNSNISYNIQYFSDAKKESKLILDNDLIYIPLKGKIEFRIYDIKEKNKFIIYNLFPKFSLILSHNTLIDYNISQNTCLLTLKNS